MPAMLPPLKGAAPTNEGRQALVKAVVALYDLSGNVDSIIDTHYSVRTPYFLFISPTDSDALFLTDTMYQHSLFYTQLAPDVRFNDSLVHVLGIEDIKGQFRALQAAFRLTGDGVHLRSVTHGERHVVLEWKITYIARPCPAFLDSWCALTLPNITVLELDEAGRVLHHDDHWSVHELLGGIPVVGLVYRTAKRVAGKSTSMLTNLLWNAFSGSASPEAVIASPSSTVMGSLGSAAPPSDATLAVPSSSSSASSAAARSARGISSGTITSVASSGARSSVASGGVPEVVASEDDKAMLAGPSD